MVILTPGESICLEQGIYADGFYDVWRFIYFATIINPANLVMLLPGNVAMIECRTRIAAGKLVLCCEKMQHQLVEMKL